MPDSAPRELIAFDIETIPDPDIGRAVQGLSGTDAEVVEQMMTLRLEETEGRTAYPQQPFHRIVTIGLAGYPPETGVLRLEVLGDDARSERSILEAFEAALARRPQLSSWNGRGFDLPIIRYRAMRHGVPMPQLHAPRGYLDRYRDDHVDVMDHLTTFGASYRVGLGTICDALGIPSKAFLDRELHTHVLEGELPRVEDYCLLDCLSTLLVHQHARHLEGRISQGGLAATYTAAVGAMRTREPKARGWAEIRSGLERRLSNITEA